MMAFQILMTLLLPLLCQSLAPECQFQVRLTNGTGSCSGRVEVYINGSWGNICDDGWDLNDTQVVCRQLGCGPAREAYSSPKYGSGSKCNAILMKDVACSGTENRLGECQYGKDIEALCDHTEDVGVDCEDTLQKDKDDLQKQRDTLKTEKDTQHKHIDTLQKDKDDLQKERDTLKTEKDALQKEKDISMKFREALLEYKGLVTLDPDTAHPKILLSEDQRRMRDTGSWQTRLNNDKEFSRFVCVVGSEGFTSGRHYWELQLLQEGTGWHVGVAAESVSRTEQITWSPEGGVWALYLVNGQYLALTSPRTTLSPRERPQKLGVYLDYEAGRVSLYNANSMEHLHTFPQASFTQGIFPFFCLWTGAELRLL